MKELEPKAKIEKHELADQQKEFKLLGRIRVEAGHKLFSYNTKTFRIEEVKPNRKVAVDMKGKEQKLQESVHDPDCFYISSLNIKNAKRKIVKLLNDVANGKTDGVKVAQLPS